MEEDVVVAIVDLEEEGLFQMMEGIYRKGEEDILVEDITLTVEDTMVVEEEEGWEEGDMDHRTEIARQHILRKTLLPTDIQPRSAILVFGDLLVEECMVAMTAEKFTQEAILVV